MRLSASWIVPVTLVVLVVACNTFDPDSCFPNTSGGYGGSETIPIGAAVGAGSGDFATPGEGPLDYGANADPCIEPQSPCNQRCESNQNAAALECGKIADVAQRMKCQEAAYVVYKSCREKCVSAQKTCLDMYEDCTNRNYAPCNKKFKKTLLCSICQDNCLNGGPYKFAECTQCGFE